MALEAQGNWIAAACSDAQTRLWLMQDDRVLTSRVIAGNGAAGPGTVLDAARDLGASPDRPLLVSGAPDAAPVTVPAKPLELVPLTCRQQSGIGYFALPGLRQSSPPARMRNAATGIAGFIALNPNWDGVLCLPGSPTHWVQISAGEVVSFQSFLSLPGAATLLELPQFGIGAAGAWAAEDLGASAEDVMARPERLMARICELQVGLAEGNLSAEVARSRLIGAFIGAELSAAKPYWLGQNLAVLEGGPGRGAYVAALKQLHVPVMQADADRMTLEGLIRGWRRLSVGA